MVDIKNILSKSKLSRTDLSQVYKKIKELKLNISWLELFRKATRDDVLLKGQIKLEPKKIKFLVSGTMIKTEITIFANGFQKQNSYQEKYNEIFYAFDKKDALQQARDYIAEKDVVGADYSGISKRVLQKQKT